MTRVIETERLELRPWEASDLTGALEIYGAPPVARWLAPGLSALATPEAMRPTLLRWHGEQGSDACEGHWAIQSRETAGVVGGMSLQFEPTGGESLTIAWALAPSAWGHGYAAEAGDALIRWAIHEAGALEVFAIVQPDNARAAATAKRIGMEWVEELGDHRHYEVYRIRHGDLDYED